MSQVARWVLLGQLATVGCSDTVLLQTDPDGISLEYRCDSPGLQAKSSAERSLVRDHALRVVRAANAAARMSEVRELMAAEARADWDGFEIQVIEHLCADKSLLVAPSPSPARITSGLERGSLVPGFTLPVLTRSDATPALVNLEDLRGQYVIISFWATWC